MIGKITGEIIEKQPLEILIDCHGVGYEINISMMSFYELPELHHQVSLYTHFIVREDAQLLYGFVHQIEKQLFKALIKINGIGPKVALTILSNISVTDFVRAVDEKDIHQLVKIPGIGKKTGERLLIEIQDKLSKLSLLDIDSPIRNEKNQTRDSNNTHFNDAIAAMIALGYKKEKVEKSIRELSSQYDTSEQLIKAALKTMH